MWQQHYIRSWLLLRLINALVFVRWWVTTTNDARCSNFPSFSARTSHRRDPLFRDIKDSYKIQAIIHCFFHRLFLYSQSKPSVIRVAICMRMLYYMLNSCLHLGAYLRDTISGNRGSHATRLFLLPQREPDRKHSNVGNRDNHEVTCVFYYMQREDSLHCFTL